MSELKPKIYVACLAAYTSRYLPGDWIDAAQDPEDLLVDIKTMLAKSPIPNAEEWAIHDTDDLPYTIIREFTDLKTVSEVAFFIEEHGALGFALMNERSFNVEDATKALKNYYAGEYESEQDFATNLFDELYPDVPEPICYYIDYEQFCSDIFINDYYSVTIGTNVHVFNYH